MPWQHTAEHSWAYAVASVLVETGLLVELAEPREPVKLETLTRHAPSLISGLLDAGIALGLVEKLNAPDAAVLDVGAGLGGIGVAAARTWPKAQVVGLEPAPARLAEARRNVAASGVADRIDPRPIRLDELTPRLRQLRFSAWSGPNRLVVGIAVYTDVTQRRLAYGHLVAQREEIAMSTDVTYANPAALVSTDWVSAHLDNPQVRLVEVDVDTTAYERGHIQGAAGLNWTTQLGDPIRRDIPSRVAFERLMGQVGVSNDTHLVFYGDNNNWFAAFAYWVARIYGHSHASLMNGGRKKWELEARELVTEAPRESATSYHAGEPDVSLRAYLKDVLAVVEAGQLGTTLVDVRSPAEFTGEIMAPPGLPETAQRSGHIPGAENLPWAQAVNEDGTFKTAPQLRELYEAKGITPDKPAIAYCRIGERSSHTWFVLKELLGYPDVRNYDGSWTEYGSVVGVPIHNPAAERQPVPA